MCRCVSSASDGKGNDLTLGQTLRKTSPVTLTPPHLLLTLNCQPVGQLFTCGSYVQKKSANIIMMDDNRTIPPFLQLDIYLWQRIISHVPDLFPLRSTCRLLFDYVNDYLSRMKLIRIRILQDHEDYYLPPKIIYKPADRFFCAPYGRRRLSSIPYRTRQSVLRYRLVCEVLFGDSQTTTGYCRHRTRTTPFYLCESFSVHFGVYSIPVHFFLEKFEKILKSLLEFLRLYPKHLSHQPDHCPYLFLVMKSMNSVFAENYLRAIFDYYLLHTFQQRTYRVDLTSTSSFYKHTTVVLLVKLIPYDVTLCHSGNKCLIPHKSLLECHRLYFRIAPECVEEFDDSKIFTIIANLRKIL